MIQKNIYFKRLYELKCHQKNKKIIICLKTLDQIKILHILAFKILFRAMRKYKEAPKVNHGFRGDDMIRVIKIDVSELKSKLSCEEFIIPLSLVLAAVHHCDFHFSKFDAFAILIDMANHVNDQIVLERIVPTFLKFTQ